MSATSARSAAPRAARRIPDRRILGDLDTRIIVRRSERQSQQRRLGQRGRVSVAASISPRPPTVTTAPAPGSPPPGFSAPDATSFRIAVLGDLHYDPRDEKVFDAAREQLSRVLREKPGVLSEKANGGVGGVGGVGGGAKKEKNVSRLVQLGDLGASSFSPGTPQCFRHARKFLGEASLEREGGVGPSPPFAPPALVVGNHDLEGATFDEIGLRFSGSPSLSSRRSPPPAISSYGGDSSDEEGDEESLSGGAYGDNARTRLYPSALAAAEAADAANLDAWRSAFSQSSHWRAELGRAVLLGISTTRFRSNANSVHEVHVDGEQWRWLEERVSEAEGVGRPVVVFSHAPPAGCGLRVVRAVHVRNRCAYLNHGALDREETGGAGGDPPGDAARSGRLPPPPPDAFIRLVERHPNIRLWLSGHYHLSHNYSSSASSVNGCAFAQVGVIGPRSTRDGMRQSRILDGHFSVGEGGGSFELSTLDHDTGETRVDVRGTWDWRRRAPGDGLGRATLDVAAPEILPVPADELLDPEADALWLSSQVDCGVEERGEGPAASVSLGGGRAREGGDEPTPRPWPAPGGSAPPVDGAPVERTQWLPAGGDALLAFSPSKGELLEYSARMRCPVGFVLDKLPTPADLGREGAGELRARLVDADGEEVYPNSPASPAPPSSDSGDAEAAAARAAAVEVVVAATGEVVGRRGRNARGSFYHVYQANKWRKKVKELTEGDATSVPAATAAL